MIDAKQLESAATHLGDGVRIDSLARLSGGASRELWSFDAVLPDGERRPLLLRRDPEAGKTPRVGRASGRCCARPTPMTCPCPSRCGSGQDRPDAPELLAAVARWLYDELRPTLPREQRFDALVAANCCAILAREWGTDGPGTPDRTAEAELARAIRAGDCDDRWDDVLERVHGDVRCKLAVAHPGYDAIADDGRDKER